MKVLVFPLVLILCYTSCQQANSNRRHIIKEEDPNRLSYFLVETANGTYQIEDLTATSLEVAVSASDVAFYFCSQSTPNCTSVADVTTDLPEEIFDPRKDILACIHGCRGSNTSSINTLIRDAVLDKFDVNFIIVDWGNIANENYIVAKDAVPQIGGLVAEFLQHLITAYDVPVTQIGIVGHSLGAHVSGVAGSHLGGQINHIVGLDPAGPLVSVLNTDYRLDPSDAQFVQVIHTNAGFLGLSSSLGNTDYYPNGGSIQPGCELDITGSCSHSRSYEYYASSISNEFISQECSSFLSYSLGGCNGNFSLMEGYSIDTASSGDFYLKTSEDYPYDL